MSLVDQWLQSQSVDPLASELDGLSQVEKWMMQQEAERKEEKDPGAGYRILPAEQKTNAIRSIPGRGISHRQWRGGRCLPASGERPNGTHGYAMEPPGSPGHVGSQGCIS